MFKKISSLAVVSFCLLFTHTSFSQTYSVSDVGDWGYSHSSYPPANAVDNVVLFSSRWAANFSTEPVNLWVDLGSAQTVDDVGIAWGRGNSRTYEFEIWGRSGTSGTWTKIFDGNSSGTTDQIESYNVTDMSARQVRVKVFSNSAGSTWADVVEFEVYGTAGPGGSNSGGGSGSSSSTFDVPGLIEAEEFSDYYDTSSNNQGGDYRTDEAVDVESCSDSGCGYSVGWMRAGEWLEYEIDVASSGNYEAQVRVASSPSSGQLSFEIDGSQVSNVHSVGATGGWQNWETQTVDLGYISSGTHTLRLNVESSSFNINWINIVSSDGNSGGGNSGTTFSVPGLIEAEEFVDYYDTDSNNRGGDYRTDESVDVQNCVDSGCGYNIGWMYTGEWLEYDINVQSAGDYTANVRVASSGSSGQLSFDVDGSQVSSVHSVGSTGGWQNWETQSVDLGYLTAGNHTLRLNVENSSFNLNWINIVESSDSGNGGGGTGTGDFGLDPNADPWDNFDLTGWSLDTPAPRDDEPCKAERTWDYQWDDSNPLDSSSAPYFYTHSDGGMRFVTRIDGQTTSDSCTSGYVRSELREMMRRGDNSIEDTGVTENNWALGYQPSGSGWGGRNGVLSGTLRVNQVTTSGSSGQIGRVIIGQIHAGNDEPLRLYYRHRAGQSTGCIYFAHEIRDSDDVDFYMIGNESCTSAPSNGIALGELFSYTITNEGSEIEVVIRRGDYDGSIIATETIDMNDLNSGYDRSDEWMYFKAGAYTQNNSGNDSDGDIVTFYRLSVSHDNN